LATLAVAFATHLLLACIASSMLPLRAWSARKRGQRACRIDVPALAVQKQRNLGFASSFVDRGGIGQDF
jgi:hypothetical protein